MKAGDILVKKSDLCRNFIFFVAEGEYVVSDNFKKSYIYGENSFIDMNDSYKFDVKMKENGKIAWTTVGEVIKSFSCSFHEAIQNSASIFQVLEAQKHNRNNLHEISKNLKLSEFEVLKKLGEGQFGHVFLVTDSQKQSFYALKCISKQ